MRVAFYARVSTERQQQMQTIDQQLAQLRAHASAQADWVVDEAHIFRDDGCSGGRLNRPALDALRDHAARAAFDLVLVTEPDRLARNDVHQMVVLEELERHGWRVVFVDRPMSDDPHEQLVVQIRGAVAEYERTLIADRMRRGRQAKLRAGRLLPWPRAPYGDQLDAERPRDPSLVRVAEREAAIVAERFVADAAGGASRYALAKRLTDRGVPTPTGKRQWAASTVRFILTNPAYAGSAASGRYRTVAAAQRGSPLRPVGAGTSRRAQPRDGWVSIDVPAIIDSERFAAVQQRLATNRQDATRSTTQEYLLRSLVSCGVCRLACTGRPSRRDDGRYRYYVCRGKLPGVIAHREDRCPARLTPT